MSKRLIIEKAEHSGFVIKDYCYRNFDEPRILFAGNIDDCLVFIGQEMTKQPEKPETK